MHCAVWFLHLWFVGYVCKTRPFNFHEQFTCLADRAISTPCPEDGAEPNICCMDRGPSFRVVASFRWERKGQRQSRDSKSCREAVSMASSLAPRRTSKLSGKLDLRPPDPWEKGWTRHCCSSRGRRKRLASAEEVVLNAMQVKSTRERELQDGLDRLKRLRGGSRPELQWPPEPDEELNQLRIEWRNFKEKVPHAFPRSRGRPPIASPPSRQVPQVFQTFLPPSLQLQAVELNRLRGVAADLGARERSVEVQAPCRGPPPEFQTSLC